MAYKFNENDFNPDEVARRFNEAVVHHGAEWTKVEQAPQGPNDGHCWTRAWEYALSEGLDYAEGWAIRQGGGVCTAHGFCIRTNMFGQTVVETTAGFADALAYRGFVINMQSPHVQKLTEIFLSDGGSRNGIIDTALGANLPWEHIQLLLKP